MNNLTMDQRLAKAGVKSVRLSNQLVYLQYGGITAMRPSDNLLEAYCLKRLFVKI